MIHQIKSRQFLIFLLTGGFAATINFLSRILYSNWFDFSVSIILAYITGMITAFVLAKIFVFKNSQLPIHHSVMYFVLINLFAIFQTWIVSIVLVNYVFPGIGITIYMKEIAHAIGVLVPVYTSYIGHKRWSFR